ncbi:MAG: hypothetical protein ACFCVK_13545 [Acidimicrobiales bacterium]
MVEGALRRAISAAILAAWLLLAFATASCGDDTGDLTGGTSTESSQPASTDEPEPGTSSASTEPQDTTSTLTSTTTAVGALVATDGGLTLVSFGDEAEVTIQTLIGVLGPPDVDTGWQDPTDPANELWPGCPGATARALVWTGNIGTVFTDWDGDLSKAGGTVPEPYFAGYGLWPTTSIPTVDGGSPGSTLAEARAIYGDRLWVSDQPDGAVELYSFAIDGTGSPLTKTGPLRGWLFPPDGADPALAADGPGDDWTLDAFTAGVSCSTP